MASTHKLDFVTIRAVGTVVFSFVFESLYELYTTLELKTIYTVVDALRLFEIKLKSPTCFCMYVVGTYIR